MAKRTKYSEEFKRETVGLIRQPGANVTQIAKELGVGSNLLFRWRAPSLTECWANSRPIALSEQSVREADGILQGAVQATRHITAQAQETRIEVAEKGMRNMEGRNSTVQGRAAITLPEGDSAVAYPSVL